MSDENIVFIGKKNTKSYVLAVITQINQGANRIIVKARGKSISTAVDVVEMVRNRFAKEMKVADIKISTDEVKNQDNSTVRVSAIEIVLEK